jgi:hypothetical protein
MEWNNEVEGMSRGADFLKLEQGQTKVKFLDDGEDKDVVWQDKTIHKRFFKVMCNGAEATWSVTKGATLGSLYGQLALIGKAKGTLKDQEVTVLVKGTGKETNYTILESLELMKQEELNRKPVKVEDVITG